MDWVKGRKIFTVFTYIVLLLSLATVGFFIYRLIVNVTQDTTVYTVKDRNDSYFLYSKKKAFLNYFFFSPGVFKHSKRIANEEEEQPHKIAKKTAYPKKRFIFEKIDPPTLETTSSTSTSTSTSSTSTSTSTSAFTTALTSSTVFKQLFKNRTCI